MCYGQFFRQFRVLAWKNALLKVRGWQVLLMELFIPILIIVALGGVKNAIGQTKYRKTLPANYHESARLDELYTTKAPSCTDDNLVMSCLQPPSCYVSYNPMKPTYLQQCKLRNIAVAPNVVGNVAADTAARAFLDFIPLISKYASLANTFQYFASEQAFLDYIGGDTYTYQGNVFSSAVIFNSGAPAWDYTIRMNKTYTNFGTGNTYYGDAPSTGNPAEDIAVISPSAGGNFLSGVEMLAFGDMGVYTLMDTVHSFVATQVPNISSMA